MANFYVADLHCGHENILRLSNRPFKTVQEMDETIIRNWNKKVSDNDDVYILGDFSFKSEDPIEYLKRLKGKKHLIVGNHDTKLLKNPACKKYFVEIVDMKMINDNGTQIVLCHYPLVEWDGYYRNVLHFYGHVHNTYHNETTRYARDMKNAYNVGVDVIGFAPCTLNEIVNLKNTDTYDAKWIYWYGWSGNHDKRIDDAVCSKCGWNHPVVKGSPEKLSDFCAGCGSKMKKK